MAANPLYHQSVGSKCKYPRFLWYKGGAQTNLNAAGPTDEVEHFPGGIHKVLSSIEI